MSTRKKHKREPELLSTWWVRIRGRDSLGLVQKAMQGRRGTTKLLLLDLLHRRPITSSSYTLLREATKDEIAADLKARTKGQASLPLAPGLQGHACADIREEGQGENG